MKTGDSPFFFEELEVLVEGKVFLPVQALNRLRREALEELCRAVTERFRRKSGEEHKNTEAEGAERAAAGENGEEKGTGLPGMSGRAENGSGICRIRFQYGPAPGGSGPGAGKTGVRGRKRPLGSTWQARNLIRASGRSWRTAAIRLEAPVI